MSEACRFTRLGKKIDKTSNITAKQLYTLTIQRTEKTYDILGREVKRGTFHRVKSQGIDNVTKAMMTLSFLIACDVISPDDIMSIITKITSLLLEDVDPEKIYLIVRDHIRRSL